MKNFFKYILLFLADLLIVGIIAGSVIKTIVYAICGEENHHAYMLVRFTLIIVVFVIIAVFMNYTDDDKKSSFKESNRLLAVANGEIKFSEMIFENSFFKKEIIFGCITLLVGTSSLIPAIFDYGGTVFVIAEILIALIGIAIYVIVNYFTTQKILNDVAAKKQRLEALNNTENN